MTRTTTIKVMALAVILAASMWAFDGAWSQRGILLLTPLSERASADHSMQYMVPEAAKAMELMVADAEAQGKCLVVLSGHRTVGRQKYLYEKMEDKSRVARPGTSQHELGTAADIVACAMADGRRDDGAEREELEGDFDKLPEYSWLKENAAKYGFHESYTKGNQSQTGFMPEPWHWNFGEADRKL